MKKIVIVLLASTLFACTVDSDTINQVDTEAVPADEADAAIAPVSNSI